VQKSPLGFACYSARKFSDELLRDFERWVKSGCDPREILLNTRLVVDYYNRPKGKGKPSSIAVGKNLGPKIAKLRKWGDAEPEPALKKHSTPGLSN
jgi:hypothetical protein